VVRRPRTRESQSKRHPSGLFFPLFFSHVSRTALCQLGHHFCKVLFDQLLIAVYFVKPDVGFFFFLSFASSPTYAIMVTGFKGQPGGPTTPFSFQVGIWDFSRALFCPELEILRLLHFSESWSQLSSQRSYQIVVALTSLHTLLFNVVAFLAFL